MSEQTAKMWFEIFHNLLVRVALHRWRSICLSTFLCVVISTMPPALIAQPADATVTFYTKGSVLTSGLPGTKHGIFYGLIFDGNKELVTFYERVFVKNGRFVTIHLPAGPHDFVATNSKAPKSEQHNSISLEPGKQYFFRAQNESSGFVILEWEKARLDQVSCEVTQQEASRAKPLHPKHPPATLAAMRVSIEAIPPCQ